MDDPLKKLIERRHPLYWDRLPHWDFLEATYEGGRDWFDQHIFRYFKEGEGEFKERVKRAYRFNHTREVVDLVDKYLFKMPVARREKDAPESVKKFWRKATLSGLSIDDLSRRASKAASKFRTWVVVDSTRAPDENASKADEKAGHARVYAYIVRPQDVLDMSYDETGNLRWILIREIARDDADPLTASGAMVERFRLWTTTDWHLFEKRKVGRRTTVVEIDSRDHDLGVVPVLAHDNTLSEEPYASEGMIDDIAYMDRAVANYLSNLDAIIQDQTFSQLAMPAQGTTLAAETEGVSAHDKLMETGTKRVFTYNAEGGGKPEFIAPDPKQAELILLAIGKIINEIYHSVGLAGERTKDDNGGGIDNASGVAKSYDFERTNSLLAAKAKAQQEFENKLARLVALYSDEEAPDDLVTYAENFDVRGLYDEFEIAARLTLLNAPDGMRREQMKLVLEKMFPMLSKGERATLETELKTWPPEEALPGLGQQGTSAGGKVAAASAQKTAKEMAA